MTHDLAVLGSLLEGLIRIAGQMIGEVERVLRSALTVIGLHGAPQTTLLVILVLLLLVSTFTFMARIVAIVVGAFLVLMMLHMVAPDMFRSGEPHVAQHAAG